MFLLVVVLMLGFLMLSCGRESEVAVTQPGAEPAPPANLAEIAPSIGPVTPAGGIGRTAVFQLSVSHPGGASMITDVQFLVNQTLPGAGQTACWIDVNAGKTVAAKDEQGSRFLAPVAIGTAREASNSKCSVSAAGVKVEPTGNEVKITLPVAFAETFKGPKKIWVIASSPLKHSNWQERGAWLVD